MNEPPTHESEFYDSLTYYQSGDEFFCHACRCHKPQRLRSSNAKRCISCDTKITEQSRRNRQTRTPHFAIKKRLAKTIPEPRWER